MKRILIVDDDKDMLDLLRIVFRDSGYDVVFASAAPEIDYIQILHPDLILLDVRLVGSSKSGADLCHELKSGSQTKMFPVILVSAEYDLAQIASECEADMYLSKPYDMRDLMLEVRRYLN